MQKIFLTMIFAYCLIINSALASPHENGIDDFYLVSRWKRYRRSMN